MGKIAELFATLKPKVEELSQEVKDKIKANNDKMTALKANGGSQEEIDALEKENDELNGGSQTAESHLTEAGSLRGDLKYRVKADTEGKFDVQFQSSTGSWIHVKTFPSKEAAHKYLKDEKEK